MRESPAECGKLGNYVNTWKIISTLDNRIRQDSSSAGDILVEQATSTLKSLSNVIAERTTTPQTQPLPCLQQADDDTPFGETIARLMRDIPTGERKDNLKLELQRRVLSVNYSAIRDTSSNISSPDFFLRKNVFREQYSSNSKQNHVRVCI